MAEEGGRPGTSLVGLSLLVLLVLVAVWAQPSEADAELSARTNCQLAVRAHQSEPNAASFSLFESDVRAVPSGYIVVGTLTVPEEPDDRQKLRYRCVTNYTGAVLDVLVEPLSVTPGWIQ